MKSKSKVSLNQQGNISYKRAVVLQIIELSVKEIAGVASFSTNASMAIKKLFTNTYKKGINLVSLEDGIELDIYLNVYFGFPVNDIAFRVQENIKRSVESMTEFKVKKINVNITGVVFDANDRYTFA